LRGVFIGLGGLETRVAVEISVFLTICSAAAHNPALLLQVFGV
jgi:hypothetical protein